MLRRMQTDLGSVIYHDGVLADMVGRATTECYGVAGMASRSLQDDISAVLGQDSLARGVNVKAAPGDDSLIITINIVVGYGVSIGEVARNIREKVNYIVARNTGFAVSEVNVNVRGVKVTRMNE